MKSAINKAVAVIIQDQAGRYLLVKRGVKARDQQGTWENPGGGIEDGETYLQAAHREILEELNARARFVRHIYTDTFATETAGMWEVDVIAMELLDEPHVTDLDHCEAVAWYAPSELEKLPLASYTRTDFEKLGVISSIS